MFEYTQGTPPSSFIQNTTFGYISLTAEPYVGIWGLGVYKFCCRHIHRKGPVAVQICLGLFVQEVMRLCFLINDDYAAHVVWIHHKFRKLPEARTLDRKLIRLVTSMNPQERRYLVYEISRYLRLRLLGRGLIDGDKPDYGLHSWEIEAKIEDKWIRNM